MKGLANSKFMEGKKIIKLCDCIVVDNYYSHLPILVNFLQLSFKFKGVYYYLLDSKYSPPINYKNAHQAVALTNWSNKSRAQFELANHQSTFCSRSSHDAQLLK